MKIEIEIPDDELKEMLTKVMNRLTKRTTAVQRWTENERK